MREARAPTSNGALPPPLPPETRTVGQLVAETIRLYGSRFWAALAIGVPPAAVDAVAAELSTPARLVFVPLVGAVVLTLSYIAACVVATGASPTRRGLATAFVAGALVFLPFPFLVAVFVLPGLAWLAFVGLAVPVAIVEGRSLGASLHRATELGRADFVHAFGSLATLAITVFLTRTVLAFILRGTGDQTERIAGVLADVVVSPLLFLGAALLYVDQAARAVGSRSRKRAKGRRHAHVHPVDDAHGAGPSDAEVEPRPPA
jgi:hypothetical protein